MQLTKIKKICKSASEILIASTSSGQQWLGTGAALYPVGGMIYDSKNIIIIFDLQEKDVSGMSIREVSLTDERVTIDTLPDHERHLSRMSFTVGLAGDVWQPLSYGSGVLFINWDFLRPVMTKDGQLEFFLRDAPGKMPMVAVFSGMLACAIVMPMGKDTAADLLRQVGDLGELSAIDTGSGKGE